VHARTKLNIYLISLIVHEEGGERSLEKKLIGTKKEWGSGRWKTGIRASDGYIALLTRSGSTI